MKKKKPLTKAQLVLILKSLNGRSNG